MPIVVVTGASTALGRRLLARLATAPGLDAVAVDAPPADLKRIVEGAAAVVHLGDPATVRSVVGAAAAAAVPSVVVESTAAAYGAWPDNRVPLTEDVPLRPNPGFAPATAAAEAERVVAELRDGHPGLRVAILRMAPVVGPGEETAISRTAADPPALRRADALPVVQYLHVDDAAAAVEHALRERLDGVYNVAPDGFVSGETARALSGRGLTLPVTDRAGRALARWAWRLGLGHVPPEAEPYRSHPWVVANDRLRATGWAPQHTSEEALVAARKGSWWRELSPKRRQEVALGAVGTGIAGVAAGVVAVLRRRSSRRG